MKAVLARTFGPIESLVVGELPDPVVSAGQVVIEVAAAGVNYPDLLVVGGKYQILPQPPFIPGKEASGVVMAVGTDVATCRVGDRVMALVEHGAYCQRLLAPAANCFVLPESMEMNEAAAFGLTLQTAYFALVVRGALTSGETVLVTGAAGGVGMACIQLAHALGATVIAGVSSQEKAAAARAAGADHVIDLSGEGLRDRIRNDVRALTGGKGADVICEVVGGDVFNGACARWPGAAASWCWGSPAAAFRRSRPIICCSRIFPSLDCTGATTGSGIPSGCAAVTKFCSTYIGKDCSAPRFQLLTLSSKWWKRCGSCATGWSKARSF